VEFVGWKCRHEGRLLPRHVMWSGRAQGELYVREKYDAELSRHLRVATLEAGDGHKVVLGPPSRRHPSFVQARLVDLDWLGAGGFNFLEPGRAFQQS
jgi:hypothetical protein